MTKRMIFKLATKLCFVAFGIISIFGGFINTSDAQAETVKLTYSSFFPPTHIQSQLAESWCKEVEKRTNGKVKVEYYAGQTLTKANQCYDGVLEGISDIGFSVFAYTRGRFPVISAIDLPMGYTSGKAATALINEVYKKFNPKELQNTKVMYLHAHGPGLIHTKGKAVKKIEDMKGLKFRAHGTSTQVVKVLGGTPVSKPMPETYEMLQKGVVDGSVYPIESNKGWKLGDVTDYCTTNFSSAYTTSFFVVMNKDKWNDLAPELQKIITGINEEWAVKHGEAWDTSDKDGMAYFLEKGNKVISLDAKEAARWKAAVAPIIEDYVKKLNEKRLNGQEIIDFITTTLNKLQS